MLSNIMLMVGMVFIIICGLKFLYRHDNIIFVFVWSVLYVLVANPQEYGFWYFMYAWACYYCTVQVYQVFEIDPTKKVIENNDN